MGAKPSSLQGVDFGTEIDEFKVKYVGSVPVKAATGNDIAENAVDRLRELKTKAKPIRLKVTTLGLYLIDAKTNDVVKEVSIKTVTFAAQDPKDDRLVSFFENDKQARLKTCHTFRVNRDAHLIPVAINDAFKALKGEGNTVPEKKGKGLRRRSTSKRDALAASTAKKVAVERGDLQETYTGAYLGTVNVSKPKGDDVLEEARARVLNPGQKSIRSAIKIYSKAFVLEEEKDDRAIQEFFIRDVTFAKTTQDGEAPPHFSYIVHERRLDKMSCSVFQPDTIEEGRPSIRRAIDTAQRTFAAELKKQQQQQVAAQILDGKTPEEIESAGASASGGKKASGEATGRIIGVFEASYLGSHAVQEIKGQEVVEGAVNAIKKEKAAPQGVFVHVGTEGIKTFDSLTHEVLLAYVLKDISFTTVTGKYKNMLAFIQRDEALNIINCHVFSCAGERAFDIATAMGDAFAAFKEEVAKTGGNPFAPVGEREAPPGALFKKQVHRIDLRAVKAIGAGQFGQVYLAWQLVADGEGENGGNRRRRAVKMLRGGASAEDKDEFIKESTIMLDLHHENLVTLVGVAMQQRPWLMVLEYLEYGDLRNVLKGCHAKDITLSHEEQLTFAVQVARGMEHIASLRMVHMDLAARNCLVHHNNLVKVADFGLTRRLPEGQDYWHSETVMKLPVKWCSVEALDDRIFSEGSDVWAFGVVMWEIASYGVVPYGKLKTQEVQRKVREGLRLQRPPNCSSEYFELASSCWKLDRHDRPTFNQLVKELSTYLRSQTGDRVRDIGAALKDAA